MTANDTAQEIVLSSYDKTGRNFYTFDLKFGSVDRFELQSLPKVVSQSNGLGEFIRLRRFKKAEQFVALFALNKRICLVIGPERFAIDDKTSVKLMTISRSLLSGRQKRFELRQGAQVISTMTYYQGKPDRWEDDDGDIFWWVENELRTSESRNGFLNQWPRNIS